MATIWNPGSSVGASPVLSVAGKTGEVTLEIADVTDLVSQLANKQPLLGYTPQNVAAKGVALGYAPLDGSGIVPDIHLPPETVTSVAGKTGDITLTTSDISGLTTALAGKEDSLGYTPEDSANRGAADGYAPLGPDSKIPSAYLPADGTYKGTWNASTNTPTITSGIGVNGDFYIVSTAGTTSIDGTASWSEGDQIRFNGTIWQKIPTSSAVTSVAGKTGVVTLVQADISGLVTALAGKEPLLGYTPEDAADKGAANGYAPLGADSKVPSLYLPADAVTSVAGKTGVVTLVATDISDSTSAGRGLLKAASTATQRSLIGANDAANLTTGTVASARLNSNYTDLQTIRPQTLQIGVATNSRKSISYNSTHNPSTNIYELGRVVLGGGTRTVLIKGYIWAPVGVNYAANEFLISIRSNTLPDKDVAVIQTQFRQPHTIQIRVYEDTTTDEVVIAYTGSSFSCQNIVCEIQQLERSGYNSFTPVSSLTTFAPGGYTEITGRIVQPFDTKVFDVTSYGADKSGTTDSSTAIIACINAAIAVGEPVTVIFPTGTYRCDSLLEDFTGSNITIDLCNSTLDFSNVSTASTGDVLRFFGSYGTGVSLSSNATENTVAISAVSTGFAVGDMVKIYSNTQFDPARTASKLGELNFVETIPGGSSLTVSMALQDTYLTSASAAIQKITPVKNVVIKNGKIQGPSGNDQIRGIRITAGKNCRIENIISFDIDYVHCQLTDCIDSVVTNCHFEESNSSSTGYGVSFADACCDCLAVANTFVNVRHSLSTNNNSSSYGIVRRIRFEANNVRDSAFAIAGAGGDAVDTHAAAEDIFIINNTIHASSGVGINVEARSAVISGNYIKHSGSVGIYHHPYSTKAPYVTIVGNHLEQIGDGSGTDSGIFVNSANASLGHSRVVITGNMIRNATSEPIRVVGGAALVAKKVTISGNVAYAEVGTVALRLIYCDEVAVTGNQLTVVAGAYGIFAEDVNNVTISGNQINLGGSFVTGYGVRISGTASSYVNVSGNTFRALGGITTSYAVSFATAATYSGCWTNVAEGFTAGTVFDIGAGTGNLEANNLS